MKFDFNGNYTEVKEHELLEYAMEGGRKVRVEFAPIPEGVRVTESFETEDVNSDEKQRSGWQEILENFKKHAETL